MQDILVIHDLFRVAGTLTILACDRPEEPISWHNRRVRIVSETGEQLQEFSVLGELMLAKTSHLDQMAIETSDPIRLDSNEAQSGKWRIAL